MFNPDVIDRLTNSILESKVKRASDNSWMWNLAAIAGLLLLFGITYLFPDQELPTQEKRDETVLQQLYLPQSTFLF